MLPKRKFERNYKKAKLDLDLVRFPNIDKNNS